MTILLKIRPIDPIMVRDGRPFDATPGIRAHSLNDLSPGMLAGTIRSMLAREAENAGLPTSNESAGLAHFAKSVIRGPLYVWNNSLYFPVPRDMVWQEHEGQLRVDAIRPGKPSASQGFWGTGPDGRFGDLLWPPLTRKMRTTVTNQPAYISAAALIRWLYGGSLAAEDLVVPLSWQTLHHASLRMNAKFPYEAPAFLPPFEHDIRTHIAVDPLTHRAVDQALFSTDSLSLPADMTMQTIVHFPAGEPNWSGPLSALHPLGGKRRLAHFSGDEVNEAWAFPKEMESALQNSRYISMTLVTPAYFAKGWLPGWLDEQLESKNEWHPGVRLKLRWACVSHWQPISGWSYAKKQKPVRRMVPAGSVYFFEVLDGDPVELARQRWLSSVSDDNRRHEACDRDDGFGLSLWGRWEPEKL